MPDRNPLIDIDEDRLDQEWLGQPALVLDYIQEEADARREHSVAKAAMELVEAELYQAIRFTPAEFNLPEKPSEATIKSAIVVAPRYRNAEEAVIETKHRLDLCCGRMEVLRTRKDVLENLVKLHLTGFHSEPKADTEVARNHTAEFAKNAARKPLPKKSPK